MKADIKAKNYEAHDVIKAHLELLADGITDYAAMSKEEAINTFMDWLFEDTDYIREDDK